MLILEGVSCTLITILGVIVLTHHGLGMFDGAQFDLKQMSWSSLGLGVVVAVFSLVGFESSTAFGEEAKDPLKTIPRSIIWSLILTGLFFVFVSYVEVLGTRGYSKTLDAIDTPLNVLAQMYSVPWLSIPLSIGAMVSFFALALSCNERRRPRPLRHEPPRRLSRLLPPGAQGERNAPHRPRRHGPADVQRGHLL